MGCVLDPGLAAAVADRDEATAAVEAVRAQREAARWGAASAGVQVRALQPRLAMARAETIEARGSGTWPARTWSSSTRRRHRLIVQPTRPTVSVIVRSD